MTTNDLISRQSALALVRDVCNAIMSCCGSHYDEEVEDEVYDDIREVDAILKCNKEIRIALKNLPSAQPEKRTGSWLVVETHSNWSDFDTFICTNCDAKFEKFEATKFCPNCGARMVDCANVRFVGEA